MVRSDDGGETFSYPIRLSDGSESTGPPRLTGERDRVFVVWDQIGGTEAAVMLARVGEPPRDLSEGRGGFLPTVATLDDLVVIAWYTDTLVNQEVYVVRSNDGGESFSAPVKMSTGQERAYAPSVAIDDNGVVFIAWHDRTRGIFDIFVTVSDDGARSFGEPRRISGSDDGAIYPGLAKSPDGGAALAWLSAGAVLLGEVSPEGDLATTARLLNVPDDAGPPRVAQTASGPIVAWDDIGPVSREIDLSDGAPSKMAPRLRLHRSNSKPSTRVGTCMSCRRQAAVHRRLSSLTEMTVSSSPTRRLPSRPTNSGRRSIDLEEERSGT